MNWLGLAPVAAGAALIGWAIVSHYRASPDSVQVTASPAYLARGGAYSFTRNPLYLGGLTMWAGWAVFFANAVVAVGALVLVSGLAFVAVPFEERRLAQRFGSEYETYRDSVPRWLRLNERSGGRERF